MLNRLRPFIARLLVQAARAVAPTQEARKGLDAVMVALGRGGPGAPE